MQGRKVGDSNLCRGGKSRGAYEYQMQPTHSQKIQRHDAFSDKLPVMKGPITDPNVHILRDLSAHTRLYHIVDVQACNSRE